MEILKIIAKNKKCQEENYALIDCLVKMFLSSSRDLQYLIYNSDHSDIFISMKWANCHRRFTIFDIFKDICRLSQDVQYISHKKI